MIFLVPLLKFLRSYFSGRRLKPRAQSRLKNQAELLKIRGAIRIGVWNFVLPFWNNKDLPVRSHEKEEEVRKRNQQHVTKDFRISGPHGRGFCNGNQGSCPDA
jgi:hypothetical protein